eukprot:TRINITY_DN9176_c1_g1_i1.p1 TRINITY_DN9176_c1_g1~~TRINITY_DN9176_c1_g1_i1.p1  ORF type:complete len:182 (+),score=33.48 TRINITY_DN9176_c1_g1_i1:190-735(+)
MSSIKIVVLGAGGVGKSALSVRFVQGVFVESYDPTIEDTYLKQIEHGEHSYVLEIIDTAGTEQFVSMRNLYMKAGEVFVVVYSIVAESTFHETREIREQILDTKEPEIPPIVLVGNKLDLEDQREVKKSVAEEQAKEWKCPYIECSAKLNTNISEVFHKAVSLHMGVDGGSSGGKKKCIIF